MLNVFSLLAISTDSMVDTSLENAGVQMALAAEYGSFDDVLSASILFDVCLAEMSYRTGRDTGLAGGSVSPTVEKPPIL